MDFMNHSLHNLHDHQHHMAMETTTAGGDASHSPHMGHDMHKMPHDMDMDHMGMSMSVR